MMLNELSFVVAFSLSLFYFLLESAISSCMTKQAYAVTTHEFENECFQKGY
jgi:hypothetical protein